MVEILILVTTICCLYVVYELLNAEDVDENNENF
jgi:hypothetical protein